MISVEEIRKKAIAKYFGVLSQLLKNETVFPLVLRANKKLSADLGQRQKEIAEVMRTSKDRVGHGYRIEFETVKTQKNGVQGIPRSIQFDTREDYLQFLGKRKEYEHLLRDFNLVVAALPSLKSWLVEHPKVLVDCAGKWPDLIRLCQWFAAGYEVDRYYIRQLPMAVHTKFIEGNKDVVRKLLDALELPEIRQEEKIFERRFGLKRKPVLIRFRRLSRENETVAYEDMSIPSEEFNSIPQSCKRVFIVENQMTFLCFPRVDDAIVIWGAGYAVGELKHCAWLADKSIYYWGDLDTHGFQILSQVRGYFPQVKSFLMGMEVLERYEEYVGKGPTIKVTTLSNLTAEEHRVFDYLRAGDLRLEQENVSQGDIERWVGHVR